MLEIKKLQIEIFMGGFFSILLIVSPIYYNSFSKDQLIQIFTLAKDYVPIIIIILVSVSYLVGLVVNDISFFMTNYFFAKRHKKKVFKSDYKKYGMIKSKVLSETDQHTSRLELYHDTIRLTRSMFFNFTISALILFWLNFSLWYSIIFICVAIIFLFQLEEASGRYYQEMYDKYLIMCKKTT